MQTKQHFIVNLISCL